MNAMSEPYTVISADGHAGANMETYREYLEAEFHEEFDAWRGAYSNPFRDLQGDGRTRNWDNERRISELEADGVVAEIVFPNTVPPFFPTGAVVARPPSAEELPRRWAGLRTHNRWLADFCAAYPERRAGIAQLFLHDVDAAIAEARWSKAHNLRGGVLVPTVPDDCDIEPLYSPDYDPFWRVCEEEGIVVNLHSGSGQPDYGAAPSAAIMWAAETSWFAHRPMWQLIMSGVFERFPKLTVVMTESGMSWVPPLLAQLDGMHYQISKGRMGELNFKDATPLQMKPSEYFQRNIWIGASFPGARDGKARHKVGIDKVMWGNDYPHHEGTYPFSLASLQLAFHDATDEELRKMLTENAAKVYDFDVAKLAPIAAKCGPTFEQITTPLESIPKGATSPAFYAM
jgi:predicted TIM-barrel fold metal-dependent hydrolase